MNFGHKIAIAYTSFVVIIITMVVLCINNKDIFLVSGDYYKREIAYQEEINKYDNTSKLTAPVQISKKSGKVEIMFPQELEGSSGELHFYRPSNAKLDFKVPIALSSDLTQTVDVSHQVSGLWVLKMEWNKSGKTYMKEEKIVF
jgi:hypothetical protein